MASVETDSLTPIAASELPDLFQFVLPDHRLLLAVSGGADSVAMMVLVRHWLDSGGAAASVRVATVDHGLRTDAAEEAQRVAGWAADLGFDHDILKWSGETPKSNLQAEARRIRYRLLSEDALANGECHILTAHHLDDQAETFLIRLSRGSGIYGLAAMTMHTRRDGMTISRPLLDVPKSRLMTTLEAAGHPWIEDPSNTDPRHLRVRLRQIMPELVELGMTAQRLSDTAGHLRRAGQVIIDQVEELLAGWFDVAGIEICRIPVDQLAEVPDEVALRAVSEAVSRVAGRQYVPRLDHVRPVVAALCGEFTTEIPMKRTLAGAVIERDGDNAWIYRESGRDGLPVLHLAPENEAVWDGRLRISAADELPGPVILRALGGNGRRHFGDIIAGNVPNSAIEALLSVWIGDQPVAVPALDTYVSEAWRGYLSIAPTTGYDVIS